MPDRKQSGIVGIHQCKSRQICFPYLHPQENGNRSDVRWVTFLNQNGSGIKVQSKGGDLLNFSLWPYTQEDLRKATHVNELPDRDFFTLNLDHSQRGVGDLFSSIYGWDPITRLKKGKVYQLHFKIKPIHSRSD